MARTNDATNEWTILEVLEVPKSALKRKSFSLTGHLGVPRDRLVQIIESAGGQFHKRPAYGTTYLITNADWSTGSTNGSISSKYQEALDKGVKIITEAQFIKLITDAIAEESPK